MKKIFFAFAAVLVSFAASAQDTVAAAAEAAAAAAEAEQVAAPAPRFKDFWVESLATNLTVGQTSLTNWAAGGDNTFSLGAHVDGNANYKQGEMFWNNRLQLDYGLLYASSKPIIQKSNDRIYLESKWGYQIKDKLYFSANYDFKSQFTTGWNYKTPSTKYTDRLDAAGNPMLDENGAVIQDALPLTKQDWRDAREGKSNFLSPAYTNLALGIDWKPKDWFSLSFAPVTGGYVIVVDPRYRKAYSMKVKKELMGQDDLVKSMEEKIQNYEGSTFNKGKESPYRSHRFEFGARLKIDAKAKINDNFTYTTQLVLFEDYLTIKTNPCPRINWDNRIDWKLAKYFALTMTTNLIYDDMVMIKTDKYNENLANAGGSWEKAKDTAWAAKHKHINENGVAAVQFMESIQFGFTYTIASKK